MAKELCKYLINDRYEYLCKLTGKPCVGREDDPMDMSYGPSLYLISRETVKLCPARNLPEELAQKVKEEHVRAKTERLRRWSAEKEKRLKEQ